jgi:hypothetical protein
MPKCYLSFGSKYASCILTQPIVSDSRIFKARKETKKDVRDFLLALREVAFGNYFQLAVCLNQAIPNASAQSFPGP